jgi:hypothetical protein
LADPAADVAAVSGGDSAPVVTTAATIDGPLATDPLTAIDQTEPIVLTADADVIPGLGAPRRARARRRVARRARSAAAGILGRAERWLRSGELEADRL